MQRTITTLTATIIAGAGSAQVLAFEDFEGLTENFIDTSPLGALAGADGPLPEGQALFAFNGTVTFDLPTVSTVGPFVDELFLDFTWATVGSDFEGAAFDLAVNGQSVFNVSDPGVLASGPFFGQFASPPAVDISEFIGEDVTVSITLTSSAISNFIIIDSVSVFAVPAPASAGVLGLGGLLAARRRR